MFFYEHFSSSSKRYLRIGGILLLAGLVLTTFALSYWLIVSGRNLSPRSPSPRQLNVTGEGKIAIRPDIAIFTAGVVTDKPKIQETQSENTERSNAVLKFLKEKGIEEKDIKTVGYSIYPQYQYFDSPPCYAAPCPPRKPPEIVSYQVRHTMEVKVRDLSKVDEFLEGVIASGANELGSIAFSVENEKEIREEARKQAIEDAKRKAEVLSQDLGVRLGRMVSFSESGFPVPMPLFARSAEIGFGGGSGGPEVQPGEQEIRSNVTITYEFR